MTITYALIQATNLRGLSSETAKLAVVSGGSLAGGAARSRPYQRHLARYDGATLLAIAAQSGHTRRAAAPVASASKASIDMAGNADVTPQSAVARKGHGAIVATLLATMASVDAAN